MSLAYAVPDTLNAKDVQSPPSDMLASHRKLKVAIVHYWLVNMRGGERVIEDLCKLFPDADIFTHSYAPENVSPTIRQHRVTTTFVSRLPFARTHFRKYLPLMPYALEHLDLSAYDLVISSESGPAKGVIVRPDALHICYCHSPMRYIWDQYAPYYASAAGATRFIMPWAATPLRQWDVTSAARVDHFVANSRCVAERIRKYWRRDAEVIPPPVDVKRFNATRARDDFYLHVGEMVPYKRTDLAIQACNALGRRLIVIGDGAEAKSLRKLAGPTIEFIGRASDEVVADHYARCRALLFAGEEDFGIVPVEAMASGAPVIAFGRGGVRDSILADVTGVFFDTQDVDSLIAAMQRFETLETEFDRQTLVARAKQFGREHFRERFSATVLSLLNEREQLRI
jgi:glycosyltransferase involved in cell wall biosynthesis